ncbi:type VII secretion protein EccB [Dactylosporangium sp. CA-139066]|uniref:type VII secretion protein EccB n=1 Tax=Dactylosporangium sp. CA-139066 TaxID=3239930 RepID=UPI003D90E0C1
MASRQDQLHSYQFMVQRVVSALVMRDTDPAQPPFRRVAGATLVGVLIAALGIGGAAALAAVRPGNSGKWRNDKAIIVEQESGALFVYRDEVLHPVLNQASALLILNSPGAPTVVVQRSALAGAPRGETLGIAGAPSSLPPTSGLRKGAWTVCSTSEGSVLFVGGGPSGGTPLADKGLLVSGPQQQTYLVWHGYKHLIRQPDEVLPALVWSSRPKATVAQALLNALPSGTDLVTPAVPDRGKTVGAAKVGQLYSVDSSSGKQYFLLTTAGLKSVTPLQGSLLLALRDAAALQGGNAAYVELNANQFRQFVPSGTVDPFAPDPGGAGALPTSAPEILDAQNGPVCTADAVTIGATPPDLSHALRTPSATSEGAVLADRVVVPPGSGALVRTETGVVTLVTDLGRRHAVPVPDALAALGYSGQDPVAVPSQVVGLLPAGPALDPVSAGQPAQ